MKGILGRKAGMTQLYSEHGRLIPVTVIEVKSNVITSVLSKHKNGYEAIQLGIEDKKTSKRNKPETGHAKRANTIPKLFTKEIRGMTGFKLGSTIDASIFTAGEFVDVQGTSKGHGFSGTIKKHNQSIGPKSHGGGGGSKPQRQTGSLGDISGNKVIKGMTMPGQYGNIKTTIQNLEVISTDTNNNVILIKGSIPGPKKSFVIIKAAAKGLSSKKTIKLVDVHEITKKNDLLEKAKTIGAKFNSKMSINELEKSIKTKKTSETETKDTTSVLNYKKNKGDA